MGWMCWFRSYGGTRGECRGLIFCRAPVADSGLPGVVVDAAEFNSSLWPRAWSRRFSDRRSRQVAGVGCPGGLL